LERVKNTFVQDEKAYYEVVPLGTRFKGIEGVRNFNFYQLIAQPVPDLNISVTAECHVAAAIREVGFRENLFRPSGTLSPECRPNRSSRSPEVTPHEDEVSVS
jgi:hypothetical protein